VDAQETVHAQWSDGMTFRIISIGRNSRGFNGDSIGDEARQHFGHGFGHFAIDRNGEFYPGA